MRREGVEFAFLKSSEGGEFKDDQFVRNLGKARAAGMIVAAYHYVRSNASAAEQVSNVAGIVPKDVPVIPDVEANSGGTVLLREFVKGLQNAGYRVPLLYLPRWYWQQLGSPSLAGLPPLWSSRYPDNVVGSIADEYADVPSSYWNGYGGLGVKILQFTSSARIAGRSPLDANAFIGTRQELAGYLGGQGEEDMQQSENIIDPSTGKPALDINGHPYTVAQVLYYDNLNGWDIKATVAAINAKIDALTGTLSDDEANIIATIRSQANDAVDVQSLAKALGPVLAPLISAGATPEQVEDAVRSVFASVGDKNETKE